MADAPHLFKDGEAELFRSCDLWIEAGNAGERVVPADSWKALKVSVVAVDDGRVIS